VIAPDSFKGSLTSVEVAKIMKRAILSVNQNATITMKPMADGGEGTLDALLTTMDSKIIEFSCTGALGDQIHTSYAVINSTTVIIEYAMIAGLTQLPEEKQNPDFTTSFGIGEVIIDALDRGY